MKRIDNVGIYDLTWYIGPMVERMAYTRTANRVLPLGWLFGFEANHFCDNPLTFSWLEEDWEA